MPEFEERKISDRIRHLRLLRGMTLDTLSSVTGFTKGYLSRIENSEKSPPISTLTKIASALNVDIVAFLAENDEQPYDINLDIVKKNERKVIRSRAPAQSYTYESLAYRMAGKNMEPYVITINNQTTEFQHDGEEFIFILEGRIEFHYEGKKFFLEEGDSAYFNAGLPHSGKSIGRKTAKFLCMIYSYKRI